MRLHTNSSLNFGSQRRGARFSLNNATIGFDEYFCFRQISCTDPADEQQVYYHPCTDWTSIIHNQILHNSWSKKAETQHQKYLREICFWGMYIVKHRKTESRNLHIFTQEIVSSSSVLWLDTRGNNGKISFIHYSGQKRHRLFEICIHWKVLTS